MKSLQSPLRKAIKLILHMLQCCSMTLWELAFSFIHTGRNFVYHKGIPASINH